MSEKRRFGIRGWGGKKQKKKRNKRSIRGVRVPRGGAKQPVIRLDISHAGNNTSQTRNDTSTLLSLSFSPVLSSLSFPFRFFRAAINASARTYLQLRTTPLADTVVSYMHTSTIREKSHDSPPAFLLGCGLWRSRVPISPRDSMEQLNIFYHRERARLCYLQNVRFQLLHATSPTFQPCDKTKKYAIVFLSTNKSSGTEKEGRGRGRYFH